MPASTGPDLERSEGLREQSVDLALRMDGVSTFDGWCIGHERFRVSRSIGFRRRPERWSGRA
jgi:hypothetical protein